MSPRAETPHSSDVAPGTAIVVLSGDESDRAVCELMAAGAIAYRRKGVAPEILAESLIDSIEVHTRDLRPLDRQA